MSEAVPDGRDERSAAPVGPNLLAAVDAVLEGGEQEAVEFPIPGKLERAMAARVLRLPAGNYCRWPRK